MDARHDARADRLFLQDGDRPVDKSFILHDLVHDPVEQADRLHGDEDIWRIHDMIDDAGCFNYLLCSVEAFIWMSRQEAYDRWPDFRALFIHATRLSDDKIGFCWQLERTIRGHACVHHLIKDSVFKLFHSRTV